MFWNVLIEHGLSDPGSIARLEQTMKRQDQAIGEIREMQMLKVSENHKDKKSTGQPYHAPQIFLVGKARRLIAGLDNGYYGDGFSGWSYFPPPGSE